MPIDYMRQAQDAVARGDTAEAQRILSVPARPPAKMPQMEDPPDWNTKTVAMMFPNGRMSGQDFRRVQQQLRAEYIRSKQLGMKPEDLPKPEQMHQPWIWWALDKLRTPQFITNSLIYSIADGVWDPYLLMKGITAAATGDLKIEGRDIIGKVFGETAFPEDSTARTLVGFAWDVIADPLNFVSIGVLTKGGKLAEGIRMAGGIVKAGDEFKDITGIVRKAETALPYLKEVGPALSGKIDQMIAAKSGGFFKRALAELPSFTDDEVEALKKFGAQIDPISGNLLPGARLLAAETKYGQLIGEAFKSGKLEDLVLGNTFLEKLEKGQAGFFNLFGHSMLPRGWDAAIYKAGAGVMKGGAEAMAKVPGISQFLGAASVAASKGKALFSTSAVQHVKDVSVGKAMDDIVWGGQNLRNYVSQRYTRAGLKMFKQLEKAGVDTEGRMAIIKAIETPMLNQVRDVMLLDQQARIKIAEVVQKQADAIPGLTGKLQIPAEFLAEETTPEVINGVMGKFRELANSGPDGAANWKMIWDEAFQPWTLYGGQIFGKFGAPEDIAVTKARMMEAFSPQVKKVVDKFEATMKKLYDDERAVGLSYSWLDGYFPHMADAASFEVTNQMPFLLARKIPKVGQKFEKHRSQYLFLADAVKIMEKEAGGGEALAFEFIKDPAMALAVRGAKSHAEAVSGAWVHKQLATRFGKSYTDEAWSMLAESRPKAVGKLIKWRQEGVSLDEAAKFMGFKGDVAASVDARLGGRGLRKINGMGEQKMKGFLGDDIYYPNDVAKAIEATVELTSSRLSQHVLVKTMQAITGWWKGWTLGVRPGFHVRNAATMVIQNHLAGLRGASALEAHTLAAGFQSKIAREFYDKGAWAADELTGSFWNRQFQTASGKVYTAREMADYMQRAVYGRGVFGIDNPEQIADLFKGGSINPLSRRHHATRAGYTVGTMFENNGRSALWLHKVLNEGMDFETAAKEVAKWHFDYDDLTSFEKDLKAFIPFYTWSRKNVPLQFMNMVQHPVQASFFDKAREAVQNGEEIDYNEVSNQVANSIPVQFKTDPVSGESQYFLLRNWIPLMDLEELHSPAEWAVTMLGPIPKLTIENFINYNAFFKEKIEKYPGQRRVLWGLEMPAKVQHTLRTIGLVNMMNELNPGGAWDTVHQGVYGTPLPLPANEPTSIAKWTTAITSLRIKREDPRQVLLGREYAHLDAMRLYNREAKTQVKRRKKRNAKMERE